jgi:hypothetical protein
LEDKFELKVIVRDADGEDKVWRFLDKEEENIRRLQRRIKMPRLFPGGRMELVIGLNFFEWNIKENTHNYLPIVEETGAKKFGEGKFLRAAGCRGSCRADTFSK